MRDSLSQRPTFQLQLLGALIATVALFSAPTPASAATDPDVDPATPISVAVEDAEADFRLTSVEVFLQETAEGLPYLRLDYAVLNDGAESVVDHGWQITVGEAVAFASTGSEIPSGDELSFSYLIFGEAVRSLDPSGEVLLTGVSSSSSNNNPDCMFARSRAQCQAMASMHDPLCNADCIGNGFGFGANVCEPPACYVDSRGNHCCDYTPRCVCGGEGADGWKSRTEGLFEDLINPQDPLINPALDKPLAIEVRPRS